MRHFIHFHRRDIRLRFPSNLDDPWFSEFQADEDGFARPRYHVTRANNGPASRVKPGDTIWLLSQLYVPWGQSLPPMIDARIDVDQVNSGKMGLGYRYTAASSSSWYDMTDSTEVLQKLSCAKAGHQASLLWKDQRRRIGHYLQQMRELKDGDLLTDWSNRQSLKPLHFVSYRIRDGTRYAFEHVDQLIKGPFRVFWDRWSLPRRLAERREILSDGALDGTIISRLAEAKAVWGIETPLYSEFGSYSAREKQLALASRKYRPIFCA